MVSIQTEENAATLVSTLATTPYLPETSQVESTFISWDTNGNPTTLAATMAVTNYIPHPTQLLSTQTTLQKSLNTISSVGVVEATPTVVTYL